MSSDRPSLISDEVAWYLESRGYPLPVVHPLYKTPEPIDDSDAVFVPERVDRVLRSLGALRHTKGKWAGKPLVMEPVQVAYIIAPIFGWCKMGSDGRYARVIRDAYIEMPRKGAKTTVGGGLQTYLAFSDREPGAEVILAAASKDQAGMAFRPLKQLAQFSPTMRAAGIKALSTEIVQERTGSAIKVVSNRGELSHGANVHGALVDELHVHKSPDLLEALESGTGARRQPLVVIITTADDGQTTSVYAQRRRFIEQLSAGTLKAPATYGVVFAADEDDDPFSEDTWIKANMLYPETPSREFMKQAADKAKSNPVQLASFLRLHLGIRAKMANHFFSLPAWDRNRGLIDDTRLRGSVAYGGLDLSSVSDLTALCWLIPDPVVEDQISAIWRFWLPEDALPALDAATSRNASAWVKAGWITLTPGDVVDYDFIKDAIRKDALRYDIRGIGYDRWNATQLVKDLESEGLPMVKVSQTTSGLSGPMKELDRRIRTGTEDRPAFVHGGNPVARWMVDNTVPYTDSSGNVKPDKQKSMDKIDGVSAMVTGMAILMSVEPVRKSAYTDHDLIVVGV